MRNALSYILSASALAAVALASAIPQVKRNNFKLVDNYEGQSFFDGWDFFTDADPTHGLVNYVDSNTAFKTGLAFVQDDETVVMGVDNSTTLSPGQNRNS